MNVSVSIDWKRTPLSELNRHRFIAVTQEGQTLDGYLSYEPDGMHGPTCFDWDYLTEVIERHPAGHNVLYPGFRLIDVLEEVKP